MQQTILDTEKILTPKDCKKNTAFPFEVKEDFDRLVITLQYSPASMNDPETAEMIIRAGFQKYDPEITDLDEVVKASWDDLFPIVNLITLSLDGPKGYLGCAHRKSTDQTHMLSETFSSTGFLRTPVEKGGWQAVINNHAVVTDTCTIHLTVRGERHD